MKRLILLLFIPSFLQAYKEIMREDITPTSCYLSGLSLPARETTTPKEKGNQSTVAQENSVTKTDPNTDKTPPVKDYQEMLDEQFATTKNLSICGCPLVCPFGPRPRWKLNPKSSQSPNARAMSGRNARRYRWLNRIEKCDPCSTERFQIGHVGSEPTKAPPGGTIVPISNEPAVPHGKSRPGLLEATARKNTI